MTATTQTGLVEKKLSGTIKLAEEKPAASRGAPTAEPRQKDKDLAEDALSRCEALRRSLDPEDHKLFAQALARLIHEAKAKSLDPKRTLAEFIGINASAGIDDLQIRTALFVHYAQAKCKAPLAEQIFQKVASPNAPIGLLLRALNQAHRDFQNLVGPGNDPRDTAAGTSRSQAAA